MANALFQQLVIALTRPYVSIEAPGWGKVYKAFIGGYENDAFWKGAGVKIVRGKRHGYRMELDLSGWPDRSTYFLKRWYDLPTQLLLEAVLKKGDVVLDIGANTGMFTLSARACIGDEGKIFAFEPNPSPRRALERHIEINALENVDVSPFALFDKEGTARLNFPTVNSGEGSLGDLSYPEGETQSVDVRMMVGDDVLADVSPRLVKIDVEGAELGVLRGLERLVARARPMIVAEYVPSHLARFQSSFDDFAAFAERHGYRIFCTGMRKASGGRRLALSPFSAASGVTGTEDDIVFVHNSDSALDPFIEDV